MKFFQALLVYCTGYPKDEEKDLRRQKTLASYDRLERQLDEEANIGFQRHFEKIGHRIRRAAGQCQ